MKCLLCVYLRHWLGNVTALNKDMIRLVSTWVLEIKFAQMWESLNHHCHQLSLYSITSCLQTCSFIYCQCSSQKNCMKDESDHTSPLCTTQQFSVQISDENWFLKWFMSPGWSAPSSMILDRVLYILFTLVQLHWPPCYISTHKLWRSHYFSSWDHCLSDIPIDNLIITFKCWKTKM